MYVYATIPHNIYHYNGKIIWQHLLARLAGRCLIECIELEFAKHANKYK